MNGTSSLSRNSSYTKLTSSPNCLMTLWLFQRDAAPVKLRGLLLRLKVNSMSWWVDPVVTGTDSERIILLRISMKEWLILWRNERKSQPILCSSQPVPLSVHLSTENDDGQTVSGPSRSAARVTACALTAVAC